MMIAPAGIPRPILERLNGDVRAIMNEPSIQKAFADRGLVPLAASTPEQLSGFVRSEIVRWGDVVKRAGAAGTQ
jgi:tripartite-type tricarboxylate transporter receptor subunit TctC